MRLAGRNQSVEAVVHFTVVLNHTAIERVTEGISETGGVPILGDASGGRFPLQLAVVGDGDVGFLNAAESGNGSVVVSAVGTAAQAAELVERDLEKGLGLL